MARLTRVQVSGVGSRPTTESGQGRLFVAVVPVDSGSRPFETDVIRRDRHRSNSPHKQEIAGRVRFYAEGR